MEFGQRLIGNVSRSEDRNSRGRQWSVVCQVLILLANSYDVVVIFRSYSSRRTNHEHPFANPKQFQTKRDVLPKPPFPKEVFTCASAMNWASLYTDERFVDLFAVRGQPAESPGRLALVTVFQFAEGLSDRQAADSVRARIDWKYALEPGTH